MNVTWNVIDKAVKRILKTSVVIVMVTVVIAWIILSEVNADNDWPNMLTLVVEVAVGTIIAITVYIHSKNQHDSSQELSSSIKKTLEQIHPILEELERSHKAERRLVLHALDLRLKGVIRDLESMSRLDDKYMNAETDAKKGFLSKQQQIAENIASRLDLGIDYYELARIFYEGTAEQYRDIHTQLQEIQTSVPIMGDYDDNHTDRRELWQKCIYSCQMLLDYIEE